MTILPAIDLKDGKCVRLYRGEFESAHQVAEDAVETAKIFESCGTSFVHMVDLDGALHGESRNLAVVRDVIENTKLKVELGGGVRSMEDLERLDLLGVYRMVIGSAAVSDPAFVARAVGKYGDRIAVGADAKDGVIRTHGWLENSGIDAIKFVKNMENLGVKAIIFTDIDTDGTLQGPSIERLKQLRQAVRCSVIASGGVSSMEDLERLQEIGVDGAIIGKAYYAGAVDIKRAVEVFEK